MKSLLIVAIALVSVPAVGHAQEVTLRGVSAFAAGTAFSRPYEALVQWVNEKGKGVLQIQNVGGPEAMPPFEVGNSVSSGVVDIANITSAFYGNVLPEMDALKLADNTIQDQRANGCYELIDMRHQDGINAKYLGRTGDHVNFHLYLTRPIDSSDLSGLTIRTTPIYQAMFERLGATPVTTAPGDVYTALERGTIDGYGWPIQGVLDLGWDEQTNYRVDPGFYQVDVNILVNLDRWNSLTDEQRQLLEEGMSWLEEQNELNLQRNEEEVRLQADAGIAPIELSEAEQAKWMEAADIAGWEATERADAAFAEALRGCLSN